MDPDTFRGDVGVDGPDIYWRRRVSVLTGALVVVAVVAWACTSASGGSGPGPAGRHGGAGVKEASATPAPSPTPAGGSSAKPATPPVTPAPSPARPRRTGERCENADLVLSLRGESEVYSGKGAPSFLLTVVNTGHADCVVDVGPRAVELRITSGDDRVWSTADCLSGDRRDVRRLRRGVPHVRVVGWDRHRSAPDCRAARTKARDGTYVAVARLGGLRSPKVVFRLR